jgi:hypothetical protein
MPLLIIAAIIILIAIYIKKSNKGGQSSSTRSAGRSVSSSIKGKVGEIKVNNTINSAATNTQYTINNLVLLTENGKTSQIDHVVINRRGIFVIETKNYSGNIYGNENQQEWTQVLQYGKVKNKFYNPIKQNKAHIYHISTLISEKVPITSAVVFVSANIQFVNAPGVYTTDGLKKLLKSGPDVLSPEQMRRIYDKLFRANRTDISNREHIQNIQKTQDQVAHNICPRCGKPLVKRDGKNGSFMGCSAFPNCKFTKKI